MELGGEEGGGGGEEGGGEERGGGGEERGGGGEEREGGGEERGRGGEGREGGGEEEEEGRLGIATSETFLSDFLNHPLKSPGILRHFLNFWIHSKQNNRFLFYKAIGHTVMYRVLHNLCNNSPVYMRVLTQICLQCKYPQPRLQPPTSIGGLLMIRSHSIFMYEYVHVPSSQQGYAHTPRDPSHQLYL